MSIQFDGHLQLTALWITHSEASLHCDRCQSARQFRIDM